MRHPLPANAVRGRPLPPPPHRPSAGVAGSGRRLLAFAGKHHRLLELPVFEGIASERPSGDPDLEVIVKFARSLQASSLKVGGFPPASRCVVDVSKVVEDPVGRPFVMDPRVKFKGSIAVFESSVE